MKTLYIGTIKDYSLNHTFMENKQYAWKILPIAHFINALLYTYLQGRIINQTIHAWIILKYD